MGKFAKSGSFSNRGQKTLPIVLVVCLVVAIVLGVLLSGGNLSGRAKPTSLVFSEICTKNETIIADNDGRYRDYVELYNGGEDTNLKGLCLSDGRSKSEPFGDIPMPSGSYCLLFLGKDLTGFGLDDAGGENIQLVDAKGQIILQANTIALQEDQVMVYAGGEYAVSREASPGFSNDTAGLRAFRDGAVCKNPVLLISEILTENVSGMPDEAGRFSDVIELYNSGSEPMFLGNYCLSDSLETRFRYRLPNVTLAPDGYIVVFCDGENYLGENGEIHANFALTRGDVLCLTDSSGSYISAPVEFPGKDISLGLDSEGNYQKTALSLGFANDEAGVAQFAAACIDTTAQLVINEVLLSSSKVAYQGGFGDVVEICNRSNETVSTAGWYLSDGDDPYAFPLPEEKLKPGEYMLITCSRGETGFALSDGDTVCLFAPNWKWASKVSCTGAQLGQSIQLVSDSEESVYAPGNVSLGYSNTADGVLAYEKARLPEGLIISELMSANASFMKGPYGKTADWIEFYNNSKQTVNLKDYYLSTDNNELNAVQLPDKALAPGKYYVILLAENQGRYNTSYTRLLMSLSSQGEAVYLSRDGVVVDHAVMPAMATDMSYGREQGSQSFSVLTTPTPGSQNSDGAEQSEAPRSLTEQGSYNKDKIEVTLTGNGTIYYTTDCTPPTDASARYTGPITVTETTVIRAVCYEKGKMVSPVLDLTYVLNGGHSLPVVSVVTDHDNLWDYNTGIYMTGPNASSVFPYVGANFWQPWEKQATVSLFETDGSGFSIPCGLSIFGAYSRAQSMKSFSFNFRDAYGEGTLNYPLFGEEGLTEFESFILRCSGQDFNESRMRDVVMTSLVADHTNVAVQKYRPVVLYLNGEFWGVYYIREKAQENYVAGNYNVRRDEVVMTGASGVDIPEYMDLISYAHTKDLSVQTHYDHVCSLIDVDCYIDYILAEIYIGNPDNGNIRFFKTPTTKWTWIMYDTDYGFSSAGYNSVSEHLNPNGTGANDAFSTKLINALLKNPDFKERFLRRLAWQIDNIWTQENVWARVDEIEGLIEKDMEQDCVRWDRSYTTWRKEVQRLRDFVLERNKQLPKFVQKYFGLTTEQMREYGYHV